MLDKNYMETVIKTWWGIYAEYNKKLNNAYLPQSVRKSYEKHAADAKERAEAWEEVFLGYGYYTIHSYGGEIEVIHVNDLDKIPF